MIQSLLCVDEIAASYRARLKAKNHRNLRWFFIRERCWKASQAAICQSGDGCA